MNTGTDRTFSEEDYARFLASAHTEANEPKHRLQRFSVEYLLWGIDFVDEAEGVFPEGQGTHRD